VLLLPGACAGWFVQCLAPIEPTPIKQGIGILCVRREETSGYDYAVQPTPTGRAYRTNSVGHGATHPLPRRRPACPTPLMGQYHAPRVIAGLIIAETTMAMKGNS
jgi:hypothetical protein